MRETTYCSHTTDHRLEPVGNGMTTRTQNVYGVGEPRRGHGFRASPTPSAYALSTFRNDKSDSKRRQRLASYKGYAAQGKIKASISKSVRWMKNKYDALIHGYY
ncbi:hypothetical protein M9H77_36891 [Catharanthus roseus]|uniref:Uncharacterized protein n=1 Tax=Catharanthus roseus TaxID=4058 RepID=A0ACB9ZT31_CATRO|nr:hypothetical protein M9H77_36891 [Catharanthus roseus]